MEEETSEASDEEYEDLPQTPEEKRDDYNYRFKLLKQYERIDEIPQTDNLSIEEIENLYHKTIDKINHDVILESLTNLKHIATLWKIPYDPKLDDPDYLNSASNEELNVYASALNLAVEYKLLGAPNGCLIC